MLSKHSTYLHAKGWTMSTYDDKNSSPGSAEENKNGNAEEPSGYKGGNPSTAGPGGTQVTSNTPEGAKGHLNPSAPEDSNVTPGSMSDK